MLHRPYLQVTLSTVPLGLEKGRNVTCQTVFVGRRRGSRGKGKGKEDEDGDGEAEPSPEPRADHIGEPVARGGKRKSDATFLSPSKRTRT
jgi:hypothetical protein